MAIEEIFSEGNMKLELHVEEHDGLYGVAAYFDVGEYKGKFFMGATAAQEVGKGLIEKGEIAHAKNVEGQKIN